MEDTRTEPVPAGPASADVKEATVIDREKLCPFLLKMYYCQGAHHRVDMFSPTTTPPQSSELRLYTWKNATLGEIASLVKQAVPDQVDRAGPGGEMVFRHIYLDTSRGIYVGRDVGIIFLDRQDRAQGESSTVDTLTTAASPISLEGGLSTKDLRNQSSQRNHPRQTAAGSPSVGTAISQRSASTGKTLEAFNFVIGDYIDIAFKSKKEKQQSHNRGGGGAGSPYSRDFGPGGPGGPGGRRRRGHQDRGAMRSDVRRPNGHGQGPSGRFGGDEPSWKSRGRGR
ncbi:histone deacetylase complex subunit SAP18 [Entomortierella parvispora]|uniref:Histone deacetylase complex subunit SAP18 n=1 Tax=Entomortierella parvispora TaxID=205924 RepID=A0A9P3LSY7_9FUNG|nr:histone deacetylase complex subunit SAP18 [Entomortierella parvispora]